MKCLVIEDDANAAQYICNGLREAGYAVEQCDNDLDGMHSAVNESWDLVILDHMLPGEVDGLSIVGKLRDLGKRTQWVQRGNTPVALQPREFRLLEYLMRHEGQVITRTMLLEAVWDCHFDPQTNDIDVQVSHLHNKTDKGFAPALIHTVRGACYRFGPDDQPA